jgi:hypothetical protein
MRAKSGEGVTFRRGEALHGPEGDPSAVNLKFLSFLAASSFRNLNVTRALANFGIGPLGAPAVARH